jgi:hypothetical protein
VANKILENAMQIRKCKDETSPSDTTQLEAGVPTKYSGCNHHEFADIEHIF